MRKTKILIGILSSVMFVSIQFANAQNCKCNCFLPDYGVKNKKCLSECYRTCSLGWELKPTGLDSQNSEQTIDVNNKLQLKVSSISLNSFTWKIVNAESILLKNDKTDLASGEHRKKIAIAKISYLTLM